MGPHDEIGESVSVHVPGSSGRDAQLRVRLIALDTPISVGRRAHRARACQVEAGSRSVVDKDFSVVGLGVVEEIGSDDDGRVTVPVQVAQREG